MVNYEDVQKSAAGFMTRNYSSDTGIAQIIYSPAVDLKQFMLEYIKRRLRSINQLLPSNLPDHV